MAIAEGALYALNRGLVSPLALARVDVDRLAMSAEEQTNLIPRVMGSASFRPGTEYIAQAEDDAYFLPFVFSVSDTALIEFSDSEMRVYVSEAVVSRDTVSTTITNGTFASDISGWTDNDESGAASAWDIGGYAGLTGTGTNAAILEQEITVASADQNSNHGVDIVIERGPVKVSIGTSSGDDDLFVGELGEGYHSIEVNPGGNSSFFIELSNRRGYEVLVDSVSISSGGEMVLTSPYAAADLPLLRFDQSADVVYLACSGYQQYKIERRATRSWSLVKYLPEDGPFLNDNQSNVSVSVNGISGAVTLTASQPLFQDAHVGALWRLDSAGQFVEEDITAEATFTNDIRVFGIQFSREFTVTVAGTWSGTVTLQRSIGEPGSWVDVATYTGNTTLVFQDKLDNQIAYYRIGIKSGDYTSGTAEVSLEYSGGSITGIVRISTVNSETSAGAYVLQDLGNTGATTLWAEGAWSDYRGYPSATALFEGRLWWAGKSNIWGSASDAFESFDNLVEGDDGPIIRSIGEGPVDNINWLLPLERLVIGTDASERVCKSSSFDEPLSPTAFSAKDASTQGSDAIRAVKLDTSGLFVQRSGIRLYELVYDGGALGYASDDAMKIYPRVASPGIVELAVQRQPDTRIHCVLSDGTVAMLVLDRAEEVRAWVKMETRSGDEVKQILVLPGDEEDDVYYVIDRSVNGSTVRYLEKIAQETENQGGLGNKCVDSHVVRFPNASSVTFSVDHLIGEDVVVWAAGDSINDANGDPKTFTVSGAGTITLDSAPGETTVVIGLPYRGRFKSAKLAFGLRQPLNKKKNVKELGMVLGPTHRKGIKFGRDFDNMDPLPDYEDGAVVSEDHASYDQQPIPFPGTWDEDARICLEMNSPRHATIMAITANIDV